MDRVRRIIIRIFTPPALSFAVLVPLSVFLLILALGDYGTPFLFRWASYTLSAYTLVAFFCSLRPISRLIHAVCARFPIVARYLTDIQFHASAGLFVSQTINLAYAVLQLALCLQHRSWWYLSMAVYYFLLFLMRFVLIFYIGRNEPGADLHREWRLYRFCGIVILGLSTILAGVITMTINYQRFPQNNRIVEIAMAAYTFLVLGLAVYHLFSYRKYHSPAVMSYVCISLASGLVSLLNLTVAMLATFGEASDRQLAYNIRMTAGSGALIYALILIISLRMLRSAGKGLRK